MRKLSIAIIACGSLLLCGGPHAVAMPRQLTEQSAEATGGQGNVNLRAGAQEATFAIYSITGQLVKTVKLQPGAKATVELPKGFYIVKTAAKSQKVVVR